MPSTVLGVAVALSLGELPDAVYQRLYDAGAHRYLLRIESSSPELYARLHPPTHSFQQRVHCLHELKRIGFQVFK
jgi:biotin synthase